MGIVSDPRGRGKEFVTTGQGGASPKPGEFEHFLYADRGTLGTQLPGLAPARGEERGVMSRALLASQG